MSFLTEVGAELSQMFVGDLSKRDVYVRVYDKRGVLKAEIKVNDPIVDALFHWMADDGEGKELFQRIIDSVYSYGQDKVVIESELENNPKDKNPRELPLGGVFGTRQIYKKIFAKGE